MVLTKLLDQKPEIDEMLMLTAATRVRSSMETFQKKGNVHIPYR